MLAVPKMTVAAAIKSDSGSRISRSVRYDFLLVFYSGVSSRWNRCRVISRYSRQTVIP